MIRQDLPAVTGWWGEAKEAFSRNGCINPRSSLTRWKPNPYGATALRVITLAAVPARLTFASPRIAQCPYCGTGRPQVALLNDYGGRGDRHWAVFTVTCCSGVLLAQGYELVPGTDYDRHNEVIEKIYPPVKTAAEEIPEPAKTFLQQAFETLHAPDAAAVMAGSAVDAMLKHLKLTEGSVYKRIDEAVEQHILTEAMGKWAHVVRLGSNRPRHADAENPHVSAQEALQSVEFAEALGHFLFVLSSRVKRGIEDATGKKKSGSGTQL